jgi:hypothetical protein
MAKTATTDGVARDHNGPDYDGGLETVKKIMGIEQNAKSIGGNAKSLWETLDSLRVDRGSARMLKTVLAKQPDNRVMLLRGFFGLLIAAQEGKEIDLPGDLVDQMHKAIPAGLHVETPGAVRPKARGVPKPDPEPKPDTTDDGDDDDDKGEGAGEGGDDEFQEDAPNVVALRRQNVTGKKPTDEGEVGNDLGAPQPDKESGDGDEGKSGAASE